MEAIARPVEALTATSFPGLGKVASKVKKQSQVDIIDIRQAAVEMNIREEIDRLFRPQEGIRRLPTLLLYDEKGLQLFEEVQKRKRREKRKSPYPFASVTNRLMARSPIFKNTT